MKSNKGLHMTAITLLLIGGLNWLLVGVLGVDIGALFGGMAAPVSRVIYVLVGVSAIMILLTHKNDCKVCGSGLCKACGGAPIMEKK